MSAETEVLRRRPQAVLVSRPRNGEWTYRVEDRDVTHFVWRLSYWHQRPEEAWQNALAYIQSGA
jgi:hypothetical protein